MCMIFFHDNSLIFAFSVTYTGSSQLVKLFWREGKKAIEVMIKMEEIEKSIFRLVMFNL